MRRSDLRTMALISMLTVLAFVGTPAKAEEGPLQLFSVTPCRLVNTGDPNGPTGGPALSGGEVRSFPVYGQLARNCGIPPTARAVALNVAAVLPTSPGWLSVYPYGAPFPGTSTVNFSAGQIAVANGAIVALPPDPSGTLTVQITATTGMYTPSDTVGLILDITGYFR